MGKTLNFDLFMQEKKKEAIDVTVFGKVYQVPCAIPAIVPVMMARAEDSIDGSESTMMVMRSADAMFGKAAVNEMCSNGMSSENLANLVTMVFQKINGNDDGDDEVEELTDEDSRKVVNENKNPKK